MSEDPICIDLKAVPDWAEWSVPSPGVKKVVVGSLESEESVSGRLPSDLAARFPRLTHLYVWGIRELSALPPLPHGLECLDVRACPDLVEVGSLPGSLRELVLERNPRLAALPLAGSYGELRTLSLAGCTRMREDVIHAALRSMRGLVEVDLSECDELRDVKQWPTGLERIDLNRCVALTGLPEVWPKSLRRLGLRGAGALRDLRTFRAWPDYLDLAGTERLAKIERPGPLRTLYLHGSGLRVPPASEHGEREHENVAERTLRYYEDIELFGAGDVKRCKVLVLGNGGAGKTCLSLALVPGQDPARAEQLGSTHGVQFWPYVRDEIKMGDAWGPVELQLWDFGGQEIYHQTHRLFMSKGAVFVVLWHPDQDGKAPPRSLRYQDKWRPLAYWLDLIHQACPWSPRIAIVCSHRAARSDELEQRWREHAGEYAGECRCFYVDSLDRAGELPELEAWLDEAVGDVVHAQGTAVPSYWEVAQDLVRSWLSAATEVAELDADARRADGASPATRPGYETLGRDEFTEELRREVERVVGEHGDERFPELAEAVHQGRFTLDEDRVRRTLEFLTHSGWLYWDERLFESRVIVGQKWALDGIYAVLDRREGSPVYDALLDANGQFTRPDLDRWVWGAAGFSADEQRLLLSFMRRVGVCFELVGGHESRWGEPVYKTFEHLPAAEDLGLRRDLARKATRARREHGDASVANVEIEEPKLHRGHWHRVLAQLGEHYGTDATYAADGFTLINQQGQHVAIWVALDAGGFGGHIDIGVVGHEAGELADSLASYVRGFLPRAVELDPLPPRAEHLPAGQKADRLRVFVSYTWNPESEEQRELFDGPVPSGYEAPVDQIDRALEPYESRVDFQRDKSRIRSGDSIRAFMETIKHADRVLVVHSDKYWRSRFCMFELGEVWRSFVADRRQTMRDVLLFVKHPSSPIDEDDELAAYVEYWKNVTSVPTLIRKSAGGVEGLRASALYTLEVAVDMIADQGISKAWDPDRPDETVTWFIDQLGLSDPGAPEVRRS